MFVVKCKPVEGTNQRAIVINTIEELKDFLNNNDVVDISLGLGTCINAETTKELVDLLKNNKTVESLYLTSTYNVRIASQRSEAIKLNKDDVALHMGTQGAKEIASLISCNSTIKEIYIERNFIGDEGRDAILEALVNNNSLQKLYMNYANQGNDIDENAANLLKNNFSLTYLDIVSYNIIKHTPLLRILNRNRWISQVNDHDKQKIIEFANTKAGDITDNQKTNAVEIISKILAKSEFPDELISIIFNNEEEFNLNNFQKNNQDYIFYIESLMPNLSDEECQELAPRITAKLNEIIENRYNELQDKARLAEESEKVELTESNEGLNPGAQVPDTPANISNKTDESDQKPEAPQNPGDEVKIQQGSSKLFMYGLMHDGKSKNFNTLDEAIADIPNLKSLSYMSTTQLDNDSIAKLDKALRNNHSKVMLIGFPIELSYIEPATKHAAKPEAPLEKTNEKSNKEPVKQESHKQPDVSKPDKSSFTKYAFIIGGLLAVSAIIIGLSVAFIASTALMASIVAITGLLTVAASGYLGKKAYDSYSASTNIPKSEAPIKSNSVAPAKGQTQDKSHVDTEKQRKNQSKSQEISG